MGMSMLFWCACPHLRCRQPHLRARGPASRPPPRWRRRRHCAHTAAPGWTPRRRRPQAAAAPAGTPAGHAPALQNNAGCCCRMPRTPCRANHCVADNPQHSCCACYAADMGPLRGSQVASMASVWMDHSVDRPVAQPAGPGGRAPHKTTRRCVAPAPPWSAGRPPLSGHRMRHRRRPAVTVPCLLQSLESASECGLTPQQHRRVSGAAPVAHASC